MRGDGRSCDGGGGGEFDGEEGGGGGGYAEGAEGLGDLLGGKEWVGLVIRGGID